MKICQRLLMITLLVAGTAQTVHAVTVAQLKRMLNMTAHRMGKQNDPKISKLAAILLSSDQEQMSDEQLLQGTREKRKQKKKEKTTIWRESLV